MPSAATPSIYGPVPPSSSMWVDVAGGRYIGQTPSKRLPVYTRGNAGEVFPEVMYPLSFTTSGFRGSRAANRAVLATGGFSAAEIGDDPAAMIAVLGGYAYLNLSAYRVLAARTPGGSAADGDQQYLGASTVPHTAQKGDRSLKASLNLIRYGLATLYRPSIDQQLADESAFKRMKASHPDPATRTDQQLVDALRGVVDEGERLFENHLVVSGKAGVPITFLNKLCEKKLKDPTLLATLLAGIGNVDSAAPAVAMWDLGRIVRADAALTALFDAGTRGLDDRLRADRSPDVQAFVQRFDGFLDEFGARGPNEWETACPTWGTDPDMALAMIDRLRLTSDDNDPRLASARLAEQRTRAYEVASKRLGKRGTKQLDRLLKTAALYSQGREKAKTTVVGLLHLSRLDARELARRCAARSGEGARNDDLWFVTADELDAYIAEPASFRSQIAERRAMREKLASRVPPFIVDGALPPFETWEERGGSGPASVAVGAELRGIAGCPGIARGRARVVLDPTDPVAIEPGDVLVAPITDPSWTPLFLAAEAVVVDVGAVLSHAVIVSRELGIPSVVSVTDATRIIPDGALIEVDGGAGTVKVLELAPAAV